LVSADAIWAATDGGLVRWSANGSGQGFTADDGLPFEDPGAIASAPDGTLWVGGGGVAQMRATADGLDVPAVYTKDDGLGSGVIRTLLVDNDGTVWAGGPQSLRDLRSAISPAGAGRPTSCPPTIRRSAASCRSSRYYAAATARCGWDCA
jgi:ligand-binding sensor domain-containing protein